MTTTRTRTLGVLLAAGSGSRFVEKSHKLLAPLRGQPVIAHSLASLRSAALGEVVVVTGAVDLSAHLEGLTALQNPDWATGQRSSVLCALDYAEEHSYDAVVIGLADQPFIESSAWQAVAASDARIAVATYDGIRGNPVRLDRSVWNLFRATPGEPDAGARALMHMHPELVREVACKGISADIDTTGDLTQWT
jgi:molybdenum cofactor cytidylyltransferase